MIKWGDTAFAAFVGIGIMMFLIMSGCGLGLKLANDHREQNTIIEKHE